MWDWRQRRGNSRIPSYKRLHVLGEPRLIAVRLAIRLGTKPPMAFCFADAAASIVAAKIVPGVTSLTWWVLSITIA